MNLRSLERRLCVLERPARSGIDPLEIALETLSDTELGLVEELFNLRKAGFSAAEIRAMMGGEVYCMAVDAARQVQRELERLELPPRPKRKGKCLKVPEEG